MKKKAFNILCMILALMMIFFSVGWLLFTRPSNTKMIIDDVAFISTLTCDEIIELPSLGENEPGFTCTGLTYDIKSDSFWIGNYGKISQTNEMKNPSLVQISNDFKKIKKQIVIKGDVDIQGVSYDSTTDTLWYSDGKYIINCSKEGKTISQFDLGKYEKYQPNGIVYDSQTNTLWVLCFYNYLLNYDTNGNLIKAIQSDYIGQDHLCFMPDKKLCFSVGNDYNGEENYIAVYSPDMLTIEHAYQVQSSYSIEGICVVDSKLYIANDGYYHDAKIKKNYIAIYNYAN